ncbi:hypothetical protein CFOL_v3_11728 [Cephalotus follicularis]|uniref:Exo_endo_phos domain-containing protein n=1 Tax=Cephalotus follicularis TaxID=3775 RepID=A0A1Q3BJS9_CEPFO|nr:hypothetical protein CFOL_v3_11728 [Cephalotus follicularis]
MSLLSWNYHGIGNPWTVRGLTDLIRVEDPMCDFLSKTRVCNSGGQWRFKRIYGHPGTHQRKDKWNLLRELSHQQTISWVCYGDFNEILHYKEKEGGAQRSERQM